jgi:hypothetical protein
MKRQSSLLLILIIFLFSCKRQPDEKIQSATIAFQYAVFPFDAKEKHPLFKDSKPSSLSVKEVLEIEDIIGDKVSEIILNHNKGNKEPDTYVRQYVAVINSLGEKEVWVNIFCNAFSDSLWKEGILDIADAGDCAFQLKVNMKKKIIYDFMINSYG